jgi:hypothetical protein
MRTLPERRRWKPSPRRNCLSLVAWEQWLPGNPWLSGNPIPTDGRRNRPGQKAATSRASVDVTGARNELLYLWS